MEPMELTKRTTVLALIALAVSVIANAGDGHEHHASDTPQDPRFEFLKSLEGTWVGEGLDGSPESVYEFRVTAGGTAVREIEMVGTPMEMVTLYYMDGADLVATHYCMLGNRPQLTAKPRIKKKTLSFECAGTPGNAKNHDERHVHGWSMRMAKDGSLHYAAELVEDGTPTEFPAVVLTRQRVAASR